MPQPTSTPLTIADAALRTAGYPPGSLYPGSPERIRSLAEEVRARLPRLAAGLDLLARGGEAMTRALDGPPGCASRVAAAQEAWDLGEQASALLQP